jgi:YfiH family protein
MEFAKKKMEWLEFGLLEEYTHVRHGVFARHGGVSQEPFGSLNLGEAVGDKHEHVVMNRELVRRALDMDQVLFPHQVHGTHVVRITQKNLGKAPHADALFTTEKGIGLGVTHADCQAAVFYDPVHEAIGVVHCGWRGSAQNVYARMVEAMRQEIGTQPQNLIVCVSPSLGPDHAEFKNYKHELPSDLWDFQVRPYYFDFWAIARKQLAGCGVLDKHIEMAEVCTVCAAEDYFSYRRHKETGRNGTVVGLKM